MGEVYRAKDTRISREVAVKVISTSLSEDPSQHYRLEQEARAAGSISHPNILAIYDVGTYEGRPFIVSELLEGETLRDRINGSALPQHKAVGYALQIARGLAAAHDKGIIHRDLKPENIFLTKDGHVKILDFGLVKIIHNIETLESQAGLSTLTLNTQPGTLIGTVGYMSPEQARALPLDYRSDIFSFGAILYEMLWGERAFQRDSAIETLHAILNDNPPRLVQATEKVSAELARVMIRCLEKNPKERFQSTQDLAFNLESLSGGSLPHVEPLRMPKARFGLSTWMVLASLILLVGTLAFGSFLIGKATVQPSLPSFHRLTYRRGTLQDARFAPDGNTIYYSAWWDGKKSRVFWARPGNPESSIVDLPEETGLLSISSSGELAVLLSIGTPAGPKGVLARVPLTGGTPREVLENVLWADWGPDNQMAIVRNMGQQMRLEFPAGKILYQTSGSILCPRVSPDGKMVAFIHRPVPGEHAGSVVMVDRAGTSHTLSAEWSNMLGLAWSATGDEVWFTAADTGNSWGLHAASLSGKTRSVAWLPNRVTLTDISRDGRVLLARESIQVGMMFLSPDETKERDLYWLDGSIATDLSDDGKTLLFIESREAAGKDFISYIRKTNGSPAVRLGDGFATALSPDGKWAISIPRGSPAQIVLLPTGPGEPRRLTNDSINHLHDFGSSNNLLGAFWFPDGKRILFSGNEPGHNVRCFVQDVEGGPARPITPEGNLCALISPDGKLVASINADQQAFLSPVDGGEPMAIKGLAQGEIPIQWSPDGRSLYVHKEKELPNKIYQLDISTGTKKLWKELTPLDTTGLLYFGPVILTPDGKSYVYSYGRNQSDLFLVDGLK